METLSVKMLSAVKSLEANQVYDLDVETANQYIELGLAEKSLSDDPTSKICDAVRGVVETVVEERFAGLEKNLKRSRGPVITLDESDKCQKSSNDFYRSLVKTAHESTAQKGMAELSEFYTKSTLNTTNREDGGFVVPHQFVPELFKVDDYKPVMYDLARKVSMSTKSIEFPALDQTGTPADGNSASYGGATFSFISENESPVETEIKGRSIKLEVSKCSALLYVTPELIADAAIDISTLVNDVFRNGIMKFVDGRLLFGTGANQPYGCLRGAAAISVTRTTANRFKSEDVAGMVSRLSADSLSKAYWIMSPSAYSQASLFTGGNGFVWHPDYVSAPHGMLWGRPIRVSDHMSELGTAKDVALVVPSSVVVGERGAPVVSASKDYKFNTGATTIRIDWRLDGQPALNAAIKRANGSGVTESHYIYLT